MLEHVLWNYATVTVINGSSFGSHGQTGCTGLRLDWHCSETYFRWRIKLRRPIGRYVIRRLRRNVPNNRKEVSEWQIRLGIRM
jgi:hypothetical protein